jgi:hypothetical protein
MLSVSVAAWAFLGSGEPTQVLGRKMFSPCFFAPLTGGRLPVPAAIILRYRLWPDAERFLTMPQSVVWTIRIVGGVDDQHVGLGPVGDVGWDRSQQPQRDAAAESDIADDQ